MRLREEAVSSYRHLVYFKASFEVKELTSLSPHRNAHERIRRQEDEEDLTWKWELPGGLAHPAPPRTALEGTETPAAASILQTRTVFWRKVSLAPSG